MNAKQVKKARKQIQKEITRQMDNWLDDIKKLSFRKRIKLAWDILVAIRPKKVNKIEIK